jgi:hypothetical protein
LSGTDFGPDFLHISTLQLQLIRVTEAAEQLSKKETTTRSQSHLCAGPPEIKAITGRHPRRPLLPYQNPI